jgi:hypothetical protein
MLAAPAVILAVILAAIHASILAHAKTFITGATAG